MGVRTIDELRLTDTLTMLTIQVIVRGEGSHEVYEVHCDDCGEFTVYEQRSAAETYGPSEHECWEARNGDC